VNRRCLAVALVASAAVHGCRPHRTVPAQAEGGGDAAVEEVMLPEDAGASVEGGPPAAGIAALRSPTPIFSRPGFPPRDPSRTADEAKSSVALGSLRKGQHMTVKGSVLKTTSCPEGWFALAPEAGAALGAGWICGKFATLDLESKELRDAPHPPYTDRPLPYDYGLNLTNGTPMYRRPPLRSERAVYEKGLLVAGKKAEEREVAAKEATAEKGETPWYLTDNPRASGVTLDTLKGESALVLQRMVRGFYVGLDREVTAFSGKFWHTTGGAYIPFDHILVHKTKTEFEGVWVGHEDEPRKLPLGFSLRSSAREYHFADPAQEPTRGDRLPRFTIAGLTGKHVVHEQRAYDETADGWWLRDQDGTITRPGRPPPDLSPGEKWIDVNLTTQTLVAFEGAKPVYATLVSTGRRDEHDDSKNHPTPSGRFRIAEKHISTTMDDDSASDGPYSIEDVPWVMYFERSYALHGAFWHSAFGKEHSHGCVNILPHDARELFQWAGPTLPSGWHSVRATAANPGTRVVVHE